MPQTASPLTVLVIDDDPVMTEILTLVLSLQGHTILTADSGEAGLYLVADPAQPLDVVLTDLQLPGLRGPELVAEIRKVLRPPTLLLGMSGSMPPAVELEVFDGFLMKPFTVEDFAAAVAKAQSGAAGSGSVGEALTAEEDGAAVLDENIFAKMAAQLKPEQMRQLYDLTVSDVRKRLNLMRGYEAAGDPEGVRREAHAIKGGCGMVGAAEIYRMASQKEAGSPPDTPPLADFDAACDRLRRMLDKRL